jgi:hypothetical protein
MLSTIIVHEAVKVLLRSKTVDNQKRQPNSAKIPQQEDLNGIDFVAIDAVIPIILIVIQNALRVTGSEVVSVSTIVDVFLHKINNLLSAF